MDENERQITAKALLGRGMAARTADTIKLRQLYGQENADAQINGKEFPSFEVWAQQYRQPEPTAIEK